MDVLKVGNFIKEIRIKNKLTQKEFADKFGVTYQAVSKWERGINLPDINILKEICNVYDVSIDEVLDGTKKEQEKEKKVVIRIGILLFLGLILFIGVIIFLDMKEDDFSFKTLSSTCSSFDVNGSIAYNDNKSSIYISNIDYCGEDDDTLYKSLECVLYEVDGDLKREVSKYFYSSDKNISLDEFLGDVSFQIDDYKKVCKIYQENSFILEIDAVSVEDENYSYKIPLVLEDNC